MAEIGFVRKSEFADVHLRCSRGWVTALDKQGRLVTDERGWVHVERSLAKIAETHGAPERAAAVTPQFGDARDKREHYLAEAARLDYEERIGKLMRAEEVVHAVTAIGTTVRARLEQLPEQMVAALPEPHQSEMRLRWREEVEQMLGELSRGLNAAAMGTKGAS